MSLWSDQRCLEDVNKVHKLLCVNLICLYSYLLSEGVFNLCWRSTQESTDQLFLASLLVKLTLMLLWCISEFKLVLIVMCWLSTVTEPASVRFVFALNVSKLTLKIKL